MSSLISHGPITLTAAEQTLLDQINLMQAERQQQLIALCEINSGSLNPAGVNQVGEAFAELFKGLGHSAERIRFPTWKRQTFQGTEEAQTLGDGWCFRQRPKAPLQIFLCGHLDTVFPADSEFQHCTWQDSAQLNAPGAADMKGGILVMLSALQALEQHPQAHHIGWTVLLTPDEEIGSPLSAPRLAEEAKFHDLGLIYEPALPNGQLAGERKGSGNFTCTIHGKAAHAGRNPEKGRNAIERAAKLITQLQQLNGARPGLTLNTGMIRGGETTNKVPDLTVFKFNVRIQHQSDALWCQQQLAALLEPINADPGYRAELSGGFGRMPKQLDETHLALYQLVKTCSQQLGSPLTWEATGGCCDGNNLSAAGLPNIDTLGVLGNFIHSPQEYIELPSLSQRAQLSALLLFQLARNGLPFTPRAITGEPL